MIDDERISTRRKWAAIGLSTFLLTACFWLVLQGFRVWLGDLTTEELEAGMTAPVTAPVVGLLAGGFALMAAGFVALAWVSRRPRRWGTAALATLLGAAMWLWLPFLVGEPVTPMVAGFGAGGLVALRAEPEHSLGRRAVAAALITAYVFLLLRFTPLAGAVSAPLLPLPALAWADILAERRSAARPVEDEARGGRRR